MWYEQKTPENEHLHVHISLIAFKCFISVLQNNKLGDTIKGQKLYMFTELNRHMRTRQGIVEKEYKKVKVLRGSQLP